MRLQVLSKLLASGIFALCGSSCLSQTTLTMDGHYWKKLSADEKLRFVQGFIIGYGDGFTDGKVKIAVATEPKE